MPANSIGGVVIDFVANTAQFSVDLQKVEQAAVSAAGKVSSSARGIQQSTQGIGDDAGKMSGALRMHLTQAGDDVNRLFDSINSGRGIMQALSVEAPKILDVFGSPWATAAGIAIGAGTAI